MAVAGTAAAAASRQPVGIVACRRRLPQPLRRPTRSRLLDSEIRYPQLRELTSGDSSATCTRPMPSAWRHCELAARRFVLAGRRWCSRTTCAVAPTYRTRGAYLNIVGQPSPTSHRRHRYLPAGGKLLHFARSMRSLRRRRGPAARELVVGISCRCYNSSGGRFATLRTAGPATTTYS